MEDAFAKFGRLRKTWLARNPPGFGFIEFEDARDADDAVKGMASNRDGWVSSSRPLDCGRCRTPPPGC